ncbi:MAG: transglutaminase family protein [Pseudomonadota bacterium]
MEQDFESFLRPTRFIDFEHESISSLVRDLIRASDSPRIRAQKLFYFVRDKIRYDPFVPMLDPEDYEASTTLKRCAGACIQKAVLLAALSRSAGIPCKLCFADIRSQIVPAELLKLLGTNLFTHHGYNSLFLDQKWVKAAPTFDLAMCEKYSYLPVEFDGTVDAVLPPVDRAGNKHIEYVRHIGEFADLPLEKILKAFEDVYCSINPRFMELWRAHSKKVK